MKLNNKKNKNKILGKLAQAEQSNWKFLNLHINFSFNVEKILFARILATLLKSGINIADALVILEEQFLGRFKNIVRKIRKDVEDGITLSAALAKHPGYFNQVYVGLVQVGEKSGRLIQTLNKVAEQQEKDLELMRKVQSSALYPIIVFISLLALAALLSYYILPQLVVVFMSFNMPMPLTTRMLLWLAAFIRDYGFFLLIGFIILAVLIYFLLKVEKIKTYWQGFLLSLPFLGPLFKKINLARFTRILGILLQSGVSINEALTVTINSLDNKVYKRQLEKVKEKVISGFSLGEAIDDLYKTNLFPKLVSQMISVGERTGTLDDNLFYLADFYEKEVDNVSKNFASVIEPILLIVVGFVVAFIAVAIISPIYEFIATLSLSI